MESKQTFIDVFSSIWDKISVISSIESKVAILQANDELLKENGANCQKDISLISANQLTKKFYEEKTSEFQEEIQNRFNEILSKIGDIDEIKEEYANLQGQLTSVKGDKEKLETKYSNLEKDLDEMRNQNRALLERAGKVEELEDHLRKSLATNQKWTALIEEYQEVENAFLECDTLKGYLTNRNNMEGQEESLFKLAIDIGQTIDFAEGLYKYAKEMKKSNKTPMSDSESNVYCALNRCYRKACGIDFDLFAFADDTAISEGFAGCAFNKDRMEDLEDPRANFNKAKNVYVPAMRALGRQGKALLQKSVVLGGN